MRSGAAHAASAPTTIRSSGAELRPRRKPMLMRALGRARAATRRPDQMTRILTIAGGSRRRNALRRLDLGLRPARSVLPVRSQLHQLRLPFVRRLPRNGERCRWLLCGKPTLRARSRTAAAAARGTIDPGSEDRARAETRSGVKAAWNTLRQSGEPRKTATSALTGRSSAAVPSHLAAAAPAGRPPMPVALHLDDVVYGSDRARRCPFARARKRSRY